MNRTRPPRRKEPTVTVSTCSTFLSFTLPQKLTLKSQEAVAAAHTMSSTAIGMRKLESMNVEYPLTEQDNRYTDLSQRH